MTDFVLFSDTNTDPPTNRKIDKNTCRETSRLYKLLIVRPTERPTEI